MNHPFEQRICQAFPPQDWVNTKLVIAVSGGADSVALLSALAKISRELSPQSTGSLAVCHVDHQIRSDSPVDARFVQNLAEHWNIPFHLRRLDVSDQETTGDGLESALRVGRYRELTILAHKTGARYVALGHHGDDQVETVLFRIFRGTGLAGLQGIPKFRRLSDLTTIVRPMLAIRRTEILRYLEEIGQEYREDPTNTDPGMTRNRIRHQVIPFLQAEFPQDIHNSIANLAESACHWSATLEQLRRPYLEQISSHQGRISFKPDLFGDCPDEITKQVLIAAWDQADLPRQAMTRNHWDRLLAWIREQAPTRAVLQTRVASKPQFQLPGGVIVVREDAQFLFRTGPAV